MSSSTTFEEPEPPGDLTRVPLSELLVVLREREGSEREQAAAEILTRFHPLFVRYWRFCRIGDYVDFVQETMVRLFSALPRLRDPDGFAGLMHIIAKTTAIDLRRKLAAEESSLLKFESVAFVEPIQNEIIAAPLVMRAYLEHLSPREQEVLLLSYFFELDIADVSRRTGLSPGAVRMTKSRALRRLRILILSPTSTDAT